MSDPHCWHGADDIPLDPHPRMEANLERELTAANARIAALEAERDRQAGHIAVLETVLERERLRNATDRAREQRLAAALTEFYDRRTTGYERDQAFVEAEAALKEWEKNRTP